jgi:hypothetical protein
VEAEEPDDVGAVRVEVLPLAGAVEADLGPRARHPFVSHVPEQRPRRVLADRRPEVQPQREVGELDLVGLEPPDGEATQEDEPAPAGEVVDHLGERVGHRWQRRVGPADGGDGEAGGPDRPSHLDQLVALVVGELDRPRRRVGDVGRVPCRR